MERPYAELIRRLPGLSDRNRQMTAVCDLLWDGLHPTGVSWLGFYVAGGPDELILAARRDKPACSPIGLHGACGRVFLSRQPLIVRDVKELGENYIACDPRDRSELVLPCLERDGSCWGVFDLDSFEVGAFSQADADGLCRILREAGLSA